MDGAPADHPGPIQLHGCWPVRKFPDPENRQHFRRGAKLIELGNTDVARDFSDVRDIARAYAAIVAKAPAGLAINLCSGIGHSLDGVLAMMAMIAGYAIEVRINPAFVRANVVRRLVGSNARLRALTGITPSIPLDETLGWMYTQPL